MIKSEAIQNLLARFESIACEYEGVECWSARELYPILGYAKWQTFENVLGKAKEACQNASVETSNHLPASVKRYLCLKVHQRTLKTLCSLAMPATSWHKW